MTNTTDGRSESSPSSTAPILILTQFGEHPGTTISGSTVNIGWVLVPSSSSWCSIVPKLIVDNTTNPTTTKVLTIWPEVFEGVGISQVSVALPYTKTTLIVHIELWCTTLSSPNTSVCCGQSPSFSMMPLLLTSTATMTTRSSSPSSSTSQSNTFAPTSLVWATPFSSTPTSLTLPSTSKDFPTGWVVFCAIVVFLLAFALFWCTYRQRQDQDRKQQFKRSISRPSLITSSAPWHLEGEKRSARQTQRREDLEMGGNELLTMTPSGRRVLPYRYTRRSLDGGDPGISPPLMMDHDQGSQRRQPWSLLLPQRPLPVATISRSKRIGTGGAGSTSALVRVMGHHRDQNEMSRREQCPTGLSKNTPHPLLEASIDHAHHIYQQQQEQRHLREERHRQKIQRQQQQQKQEKEEQRRVREQLRLQQQEYGMAQQFEERAERAQRRQDISDRKDSLHVKHPPNLTGHQDQAQTSILQVSKNVNITTSNNDSNANLESVGSTPHSARARARAREDTIDLESYYRGLGDVDALSSSLHLQYL